MAQKIKKRFFKILPWSGVGLMLLVLVVSGWQILPAVAKANGVPPTMVAESSYTEDTDADGTVDKITIAFSEAVVIVDGNAGDGLGSLALGNGCTLPNADYASAETTTLVINDLTGCTASDTSITPSITYTAVANCAAAGAICSATQMANGSNINAIDGAAPVIKDFAYQDADYNGKIDRFVLTYSEPVVAASTLSAANLDLSADGGFTGASFGSDSTDLITGTTTETTVDLGTEATAILTHNSSPISIFTQGARPVGVLKPNSNLVRIAFVLPFFFLQDGSGNINDATVEQTQASYTDEAAPVIVSTSPVDGAIDVATAASIVVNFSEPMDTSTVTHTSVANLDGKLTVLSDVNNKVVHIAGASPDGWTAWWTGFDSIVTYTHISFLNDTSYTQQITAGQDKAGNVLVGLRRPGFANNTLNTVRIAVDDGDGIDYLVPNPWSFTTVAASSGGNPIDSTPPTNRSILIDNGATETTSQTVNLTLSANDASEMMISNLADFTGSAWEAFNTVKAWTLTTDYGTKTVYAKFRDASGNVSTPVSDTINYVAVAIVPDYLTANDPAPAEALPEEVTVGSLVKIADSSSVYFIDQDNRRHAFPNATVFFSWFEDFSNVKTISAETLAEIPLGSNVTVRPGTYLVKITTDPKVYAIEAYGVLHWLQTEKIAQDLYGLEWNTKVIDIDPGFFASYQAGSDISSSVHPTGSVIQYAGASDKYYIEDGVKRLLTPAVFDQDFFQEKFVNTNIADSLSYATGADFPQLPIETLMSLR